MSLSQKIDRALGKSVEQYGCRPDYIFMHPVCHNKLRKENLYYNLSPTSAESPFFIKGVPIIITTTVSEEIGYKLVVARVFDEDKGEYE